MHENRFNEYRIPSGMLIVFLEKALTLIHMETHLDDVSKNHPNLFYTPQKLPFITSKSLFMGTFGLKRVIDFVEIARSRRVFGCLIY